MKKNTIMILVVAMVLAGALSAQAGEKERYLIGGLLGGWILNNVVSHSIQEDVRHPSSVQVRSRREVCSPVVVEPRHNHHRRSSGRYEYRKIKEWIPGYHNRVVNPCGRVETRWVPGHYEIRTEKVWVSHGRSRSRRDGRSRYVWH